MHQIEACKQQISDFERLATNYKSLEHILMLNNAVQRKLSQRTLGHRINNQQVEYLFYALGDQLDQRRFARDFLGLLVMSEVSTKIRTNTQAYKNKYNRRKKLGGYSPP